MTSAPSDDRVAWARGRLVTLHLTSGDRVTGRVRAVGAGRCALVGAAGVFFVRTELVSAITNHEPSPGPAAHG